MPKKKKETLPTYTVLIRTPAGTQTVIETNDIKKAKRAYAQHKGSCRLCIDGRELRILEADELMNDHSDGRDRADIYPAPREGERGYT